MLVSNYQVPLLKIYLLLLYMGDATTRHLLFLSCRGFWLQEQIFGALLFQARLGDALEEAVGFFGAHFSPDGNTIVAYTYRGAFYAWRKEQVERACFRHLVSVVRGYIAACI